MARRVVGLDISSRRLLAAEIENPTAKVPTLNRVHAMELPEGAARDNEVLDVTAVSLAITRLWKEARFKTKRVVLGVGNQRVLVRNHQVPVMPQAQLRQALPYLVADILPVSIDETILDFYPVEEVQDTDVAEMRGLLVAALKDSVETDVATLAQAGLSVVGVDLTAFAMVRTLNLGAPSVGTHMLVQIGARITHLVVTRDGVPQFVRTLPVGGEHVIDATAIAIGLSRSEAETLKYHVGIEQGADPQYRIAAEAQLNVLRGIITSIRSTISFYAENYENDEVTGVYMLGSTSQAPGFLEAVSEHIHLPAVFAKPLDGMRFGKNVDRQLLGTFEHDLAAPIGLALGRG